MLRGDEIMLITLKNSSCSACKHYLQDMIHLLLDCLATEPLWRAIFGTASSIFDLQSKPWGVARRLVSRNSSAPPSLRRGLVAPPLFANGCVLSIVQFIKRFRIFVLNNFNLINNHILAFDFKLLLRKGSCRFISREASTCTLLPLLLRHLV